MRPGRALSVVVPLALSCATFAFACGGVDIGYLEPGAEDAEAAEAGVTDGDALPDVGLPEDAPPEGQIEIVPEAGCEAGATAPCDAAALVEDRDAGDADGADGA